MSIDFFKKNNFIGDLSANSLMILSVMFYSMVPVLLAAGESHKSPLVFNAISSLFSCFGMIIILYLFYKDKLMSLEMWRVFGQNWKKWTLLGVFLGNLDYLFFSFALKYVTVSVVVILYETWPIFFMLFLGLMSKNENIYEKLNTQKLIYITISFMGMAMVIISQSEDGVLSSFSIALLLGILLSLTAAALGALDSSSAIKWSRGIHNKINKSNRSETIVYFSMIGILLANLLIAVLGFSLNNIMTPDLEISTKSIVISAINGFVLLTAARVFFIKANVETKKLEMNTISYMGPILTLILLFSAGYVDVSRIDWLLIGASGIIMSNVFLNFRKTTRSFITKLTMSFWLSGVISHTPIFSTSHLTDQIVIFFGIASIIFIIISLSTKSSYGYKYHERMIILKNCVKNEKTELMFCLGVVLMFVAVFGL